MQTAHNAATSNDCIVLHGAAQVADSTGKLWQIVAVDIAKESFIPDVRVRLQAAYLDERELYDDTAFVSGIMALLRDAGYSGSDFDRAELGAQDERVVTLEPGKDFDAFAKSKGWTYFGARGGLPAAGEEEGGAALAADDHDMPLDAFVATTIEEVRKFAANWRANHAKDPECYPLHMGEGDWFEQFLTEQTTATAA